MSAAHTPGPWSAEGSNIKAGGNGYSVARINFPSYRGKEGREDRAVCQANARLIAAAPELLEACERMVAATEADQHFIGEEHEAMKAAIAKARGEA